MRVCLIYDCLFPWTVGGAERWYRNLAARLVAEGHEITYLTLRQWDRGTPPAIPGVRVVAVGPRLKLYRPSGERRILPPLLFGLGVLVHLLRYGGRYNIVHSASFPYFSLLAAGVARLKHKYLLVVDWHEVWTKQYWLDYIGGVGGRIGHLVQKLCLRVPQHAFCFSTMNLKRLTEWSVNGQASKLSGLFDGSEAVTPILTVDPVVVFAGRHIPEKQAPAVVAAIAAARTQIAGLRGIVFGDGPEYGKVVEAVKHHGLSDIVETPGFVAGSDVAAGIANALCLLLPSRREGYGIVIVEAARMGVPSIVVAGPDNAAVERVEAGVNGFIAATATPEDLAAAIVQVYAGGIELRKSTCAWFKANSEPLSLDASLDEVARIYSGSTVADHAGSIPSVRL